MVVSVVFMSVGGLCIAFVPFSLLHDSQEEDIFLFLQLQTLHCHAAFIVTVQSNKSDNVAYFLSRLPFSQPLLLSLTSLRVLDTVAAITLITPHQPATSATVITLVLFLHQQVVVLLWLVLLVLLT